MNSPSLNDSRQRQSDAIRIARVLCILGVVYVHSWTGLGGAALDALRGTTQDTFRWILMDTFGRSAVPLLGVISGWLVAGSRRTEQWYAHIAHKARTIIVPLVLWNAIALLFVCSAAMWLDLKAPLPSSLSWVLQELLIVTHPPDINVQMPFLRDLFMCMVIAPVLVRWPSWALLVLAGAAGVGQVAGYGAPVILRPAILMFFVIGILARRYDISAKLVACPMWLAVLPFVVVMPLRLYWTIAMPGALDGISMGALDLVARLSASMATWRFCWVLAGSRAKDMFARLEPYMFFYFCAHVMLVWLIGPMIGQVTGTLGAPLYPYYLVIQPFLILAGVIALVHGLMQVAPSLVKVLSGGRLHAGKERSGLPRQR